MSGQVDSKVDVSVYLVTWADSMPVSQIFWKKLECLQLIPVTAFHVFFVSSLVPYSFRRKNEGAKDLSSGSDIPLFRFQFSSSIGLETQTLFSSNSTV
jgi:hypothetical protein